MDEDQDGKGDALDDILAQWARERPGLDVRSMAPIGRLKRCAALVERRLEVVFSEFGLGAGDFDALATLRRAGAPYRLSPSALFASMMVTSGTMTHRIKSLEKRGFVRRLPNPEDARSMLVELTDEGLDLIDRAVEAHVANEDSILALLSSEQRAGLNTILAEFLAVLERRG